MSKQVEYISENNSYVFSCPHCDGTVQVNENEVNCQIFRHGIMKSDGTQVNPHLSKEQCEQLFDQDLVHGCCKPFRLIRGSNGIVESVEMCDWI
jgi:hypothetical protein